MLNADASNSQTQDLETRIRELEAENNALKRQHEALLTRQITVNTAEIGAENQRLRERLQFLVTAGPAIIYSCWPDDDYGFTFITDNVQEILGYTAAEILAHSGFWSQHIHPEDVAIVRQMHIAFVAEQGSQSQSLEYRVLHQQGHYVWLRDEKRLICDGLGNSLELVGYLADISERKAIEQQLHASTARLTIAQEIGKVGNWDYNLDGHTFTCSPEILDIFGFDPTVPTPRLTQFAHRLHPHSLRAFRQNLSIALHQAQSFTLEISFLQPNQAWGYCLVSGEPRFNPHGQIYKLIGTLLDISQAKQTELKLQARTKELDRFFSLSIDLLYIGSLDGRILRLNQQWQHVFGYPLAEIEGTHYIDYVHPQDLETTGQIGKELVNGGTIPQFINRYRAKDGSYRWLEWRAVAGDGLVYAVARDITMQKQVEEAIQQQAARERLLREITQRIRQSFDLPTIFDAACADIRQVIGADRVGIFKFDPRSNYELGVFVAESVLSEYSSVIAVPVHDHCFGEKYAPLYQQGRYAAMPNIYELDICHTDVLSQFQVQANLVVPLICGEGLWGLLCVHQCSSTRDWETAEIDLVQQIATQLAIAIQQADLFEQVKEELADRQLAQQQLLERNQQLAISNEELQRATRLKDEFLANMSHELRTPLNAILGMTEGLQEKIFGPITVQQFTALKTIERSGSHLLELINDILDVAKVESGQLELEPTPTAILPLCQSSLAFVKQAALKKRIELLLTVSETLPEILLDERRIRQVLINLLNNAVKFTPDNGRISLTVSLIPPDPDIPPGQASLQHYIRFAVTDTGIGIPAAQIKRLFQPFVQVDSALNRKYAGTGLGLALVKRITELHGGRVGLTTQEGVGSCFTVDLPYQPAHPAPTSQPVTPSTLFTNHPAQVQTGLILLAEDNDANISTISSYLTAKGYRLIFAKDGYAAVAMAESERPDIILMDIQMPGLDGLAAIGQIRAIPSLRHTPIIALTALAMQGDQERCLAAGATDYLAKPVKLKSLATKISELLAAMPPRESLN